MGNFRHAHPMADQAKEAVACSIDMQNAMAEVVIGNIGSSKMSKYTIIGSGVNMTSRI